MNNFLNSAQFQRKKKLRISEIRFLFHLNRSFTVFIIVRLNFENGTTTEKINSASKIQFSQKVFSLENFVFMKK